MDQNKKNRFGLIGRNIDYSFSRGYFTEKFKELGLLNHSYENFDLQTIEEFKTKVVVQEHLCGFNVTIPYKQEIIPYLDQLSEEAKEIGAVNTIKKTNEGLIGYNTDAYGFQKALEPYLKPHHRSALILGTGGASKAVAYVLKKLGIDYLFVSRNPKEGQLTYDRLKADKLVHHPLIINCSPVGTYPNIDQKPQLPYEGITSEFLLFDLIYNPEQTAFLKEGAQRGAQTSNGYKMLVGQAEKAWELWNS